MDWATWVYAADVTNDGSNSGTHKYDTTPGAGNVMEILYGQLRNNDTSTRTGFARVQDPSGVLELGRLAASLAITAASHMPFPVTDELVVGGSSLGRWIVSGTLILSTELLSVATSQDSAFHIACLISGGLPTVTITSPTGATETVNLNQVV